ncbi:TrkH family potassium uptake protein [Pseudaestuariivita sp.]|uniref:TrkH family potassium uptake protein n=1 Tax=Pseudaestuariivita sp. TaxID=2211669 RepID=UPI004058C89A
MALFLPPALVFTAYGELALAASLLPQIALLAAPIVWMRAPVFRDGLRQIEALTAFALLFVIAGFGVVPPFLVLGFSPLDAVFEAASGITSTGLTVARDAESWSPSAHLFRGWVQWCGGFAIAFAGIAIFSGSRGASLAMAGSNFTERDRLSSVRAQARHMLVIYALLSLLAVGLCLVLIPGPAEAISVALAAVSTGGFAPRSESLASYTPLAQGVVISICVLAAVSFLFYVLAWRDGVRTALSRSHVVATCVLMIGGAAVYTAVAALTVTRDPAELFRHALNFLSGITTAGFSTGDLAAAPLLLLILVAGMIVGADQGSTGGGIKISRVVLALSMVRLSFLRARVPASARTHLKDTDGLVVTDRVIAVATIFGLYVVSLLAGWAVFLASGADPLGSLFDVASALSTVGLSSGVTSPDLAPHLKATLIAAMYLGRLEFIALLVVLLPGTWNTRKG